MRLSSYRIEDFKGTRPVLAGAEFGKQILARLIEQLPVATDEPVIVSLNFEGAPPATASWLREVIFGYRRHVRSPRSNIYPIVANASPETLEELQHLLEQPPDALPICDFSREGLISNARVIGFLEPMQRRVLEAVGEGHATAAALAQHFPEQKIGATAWNNRLAALTQKGLLVERISGRTKTYEPVLKGL